MTVQNKKRRRDIEKNYSVPATTIISVEHERDISSEEAEIQFKWPLKKA